MKHLNSLKNYLLGFSILLLLNSCSKIGLLDDKTMLTQINDFGDFFKVYIILQISVLFVGLILSIFLSRLGYIIALVLHFIWVVNYRDYGFIKVLLLFSLFTIISYFFNLIIALIKSSLRKE